jgi:hypothetical protein
MSAFQAGPGMWVVPDDEPLRPEVHIHEDEQVPAGPQVPAEPLASAGLPARPVTPAPRVQRASGAGLTSPGVVVVVLAASVVGAVIDTTVGNDLGPFFAALFVASSLYAALQVRRRDFLTAVIVPPLVFLAILGGHEILAPTGTSRAAIDLAGDLLSALALNAPTLWVGTAAAAVVVFVRHRRRR